MKTNKLTFAEILERFKPEPLSVGECCHIISKMTTERVCKTKKGKLYQVKYKQRLRDESLNIYISI
jgi:hypothetical protein